MVAPYVPEAGDIIWLQFDPSVGHEQAGHRPAVVLSPARYNAKTGLAVVCPVTSRIKGYPFEVSLPQGLAVSGVVLSDHVRNVDWVVRKARYAEKAGARVLEEIRDCIGVLIGR